ncbi:HNH endonuclease [Halomicrococcus sp. NG-SE-24]|uniref:HNH endonuclease n=1 Tax=Halomicrococcus sp. NG-SE-24 TaxID=3436928 RepID=UPI003D95F1D4
MHHVHELGKGGEDSPETVIALCPTCHRRVHYGENGTQLNQKLKEQLGQDPDTSYC